MGESDSGTSLVEAVVGIALLGLVLIGVVDAAWTNTALASRAQLRSDASILLDEAVHHVRFAPYSPCPHIDSSYDASAVFRSPRQDSDISIAITGYRYWDESLTRWVDFSGMSLQECTSHQELIGDFAVQQIEIAALDMRDVVSTVTVVKTRELLL